jgi:hypothetical protein
MNTLLQVPRRDGVFQCMEIPVKLLEFSLRYHGSSLTFMS